MRNTDKDGNEVGGSAVWKQLNCGKHHYNITFTYPLLLTGAQLRWRWDVAGVIYPSIPVQSHYRPYLQHGVHFGLQLSQGLGDGTEGELGEKIIILREREGGREGENSPQ